MADGTELLTRQLVNSTGLTAPALARQFEGLDAAQVPTSFFAKGNYFTLGMRAPFSRLIYPVPEAAGLGVHLTLDMGGQAKFGPDVQWVNGPEDLVVSRDHEAAFYQAVRAYWPDLPDGALQPGYAGIRPKISGPGQAAADFVLQGPSDHGVPGLVNLFGIESPGLTSSLAIAQAVVQSGRCCGESGTLGVTRPDIATQVRFRKEEELLKGEAALRSSGALAPQANVKILTSCPSCLQGLSRFGDDMKNGLLEADDSVLEMAKDILGDEWMPEYVSAANAGGIERVLV
jgi:L-2-hydroxyglutarate oxidase LhgO